MEDVTLSDGLQSNTDTIELSSMKKRAWQHDYFTSALPWTQRGPEATIPLGTTAPITYINQPGIATKFRNNSTGATINSITFDGAAALNTTAGGALQANIPSQTYVDIDNSADLYADLSSATASSINDLRRAFRLQEWLERNARGGARYIEIITAQSFITKTIQQMQKYSVIHRDTQSTNIFHLLFTEHSEHL